MYCKKINWMILCYDRSTNLNSILLKTKRDPKNMTEGNLEPIDFSIMLTKMWVHEVY